MVAVAALETSAAQTRAPAQSTAHAVPLHVIGCVQESGFSHLMSHDCASHTMGPVQVPAARHPTLHSLPLHEIRPVHAPAPMQLMAHELAAVQSIDDVHAPAPVQVTVHGMPAGHTMGPVQLPAAVHATAQLPPSSHVPRPASAHSVGHTSAASLAHGSPAKRSAFTALWNAPPSPASAKLGSPSGPFASRTIASDSIVNPASTSARRVPSSARPQPRTIDGITSSTTRGRVRRSKTAHLRPPRRVQQGLHLGKSCEFQATASRQRASLRSLQRPCRRKSPSSHRSRERCCGSSRRA